MAKNKKEIEALGKLVGWFVVICGDNLFGPCKTYAAAARLGNKKCKEDLFHVMRLEVASVPSKPRKRR